MTEIHTQPDGTRRYNWTGPTGVHFHQIDHGSGIFFHHDTPQAVRDALEAARKTQGKLRLWYGENGVSWHEEYNMLGRVSRSWGPIRVPILLPRVDSTGGGAILDSSIVAIADAPGHMIYRHPLLDLGQWTEGPPVNEPFRESAFVNGQLHAQFMKAGAAKRYIGFMLGKRWSK